MEWALALGVRRGGLEKGGGFGPCYSPTIPSTFALSYTLSFHFSCKAMKQIPLLQKQACMTFLFFSRNPGGGDDVWTVVFFLLVYMSLLQLNFFTT